MKLSDIAAPAKDKTYAIAAEVTPKQKTDTELKKLRELMARHAMPLLDSDEKRLVAVLLMMHDHDPCYVPSIHIKQLLRSINAKLAPHEVNG